MFQDQPVDPRQRPAVLAWDGSKMLRRGWPRLFGGLGRHRWSAPTIALLGAGALFASLIKEWQITEFKSGGEIRVEGGSEIFRTGVAWLDGWSAPYLLGLFAVTACVALVFFGSLGVRDHARIAGLAMSGLLFAVLAAITVDLARVSAAFDGAFSHRLHENLELSYGPGLAAAYIGVLCYAGALLVSGRLRSVPDSEVGRTEVAAEQEAPADEHDWPWRRVRRTTPPAHNHGPLDLAVGPTAPFVPSEEQDDTDRSGPRNSGR
ncbi:MAG TPA: hypothetical protein VFX61_08935 [Micromonosporaceae bacterium]|nr:hypothetical protein [Micromonosporaceae bacterium]